MQAKYYDDGDYCPICKGIMVILPTIDCSCHIIAPCAACVSNGPICEECGWENGDPLEAHDGK
jgi:hypothetical protein